MIPTTPIAEIAADDMARLLFGRFSRSELELVRTLLAADPRGQAQRLAELAQRLAEMRGWRRVPERYQPEEARNGH